MGTAIFRPSKHGKCLAAMLLFLAVVAFGTQSERCPHADWAAVSALLLSVSVA